jgi:hypothetical protein
LIAYQLRAQNHLSHIGTNPAGMEAAFRCGMKISVRPAKRDGNPKELFERAIVPEDVTMDGEETVLTLIVKDIYSKGSNQRYTITLSADDLAMILDSADIAEVLKAAE